MGRNNMINYSIWGIYYVYDNEVETSAVYSNKMLLTPTSSGGGRAGLTVVTTSDMSRLCSALMSRTMKKR